MEIMVGGRCLQIQDISRVDPAAAVPELRCVTYPLRRIT